MARKCDRCRAEMAPGRPRVRVGGKQLWCQTCVKDHNAPSGAYRPGSDIAKAAHFGPDELLGLSESREFVRSDMKGYVPSSDRDRSSSSVTHLKQDHRITDPDLHFKSSAELEEMHRRHHEFEERQRSGPMGKYMPPMHDHTRRNFDPHSLDAVPYSLSSKVAHGDWIPPTADDSTMVLHRRYAGQPGRVVQAPSGDQVYEIEHPSGYLGRIGHGPHMEISHIATPHEAHATASVGAMTESGHVLHPSMSTPDPVVNHARAMWHLDNWVKTWGDDYGKRQPAIKMWRGRRGLASKSAAYEEEHDPDQKDLVNYLSENMSLHEQSGATDLAVYHEGTEHEYTKPMSGGPGSQYTHHRQCLECGARKVPTNKYGDCLMCGGDTTHMPKPGPAHLYEPKTIEPRNYLSKKVPTVRKVAMTNIRTGQRLVVVAHDSGDGSTIYHCPFCGSGQVIARSDGTVECEFCHTMFTVQVQPEYNAFPQTIDGSPVQVPGMPGQIDDPTDPMAGGDPMADPEADADGDGLPDAQDADTDGDGESDNFSGPASADNQPPWLKGATLRTSEGAVLDPDDFVAHLAIKHAPDRQAVIQQVRATRRSQ